MFILRGVAQCFDRFADALQPFLMAFFIFGPPFYVILDIQEFEFDHVPNFLFLTTVHSWLPGTYFHFLV